MTFVRTVLAFALIFTACASTSMAGDAKIGDLVISGAWIRQSPMSAKVAGGFLTITNNGKTDDRLVKASAELSPMVQLHDMKMLGEVMKMEELAEGIPVPAGATVELKPKSLHVMFMDVKAQAKAGDTVKVTLTFEKAGQVEVGFEVKEPGAGMN